MKVNELEYTLMHNAAWHTGRALFEIICSKDRSGGISLLHSFVFSTYF